METHRLYYFDNLLLKIWDQVQNMKLYQIQEQEEFIKLLSSQS